MCPCVQSANEQISDPDPSQARTPSCDVRANDSKWVQFSARADQWLPEEKRPRFTLSAVLLFLKWMEFVITACPPPSLCRATKQNPCCVSQARHYMAAHTCTHTHFCCSIYTYIHACRKYTETNSKMCFRLCGEGGLMACDLPATAMTLLTYLICLSHWQTTKHTHTHTQMCTHTLFSM